MTFSSKVNHPVDVMLFKYLLNCLAVTDIYLIKLIILTIFNIFQIFQIPCIGQTIYIYNLNLVSLFPKHVMNVIGTDKTGTTCY